MKTNFILILIFFLAQMILGQEIVTRTVEIPNSSAFYESQQNTLWCWAAANVMLLKSQGLLESQGNQSNKLFGSVINCGAGPNFDLSKTVLSGTYRLNDTTVITVTPYVSYLINRNTSDFSVILNRLSNGVPVIMGTAMHAIVCIGIDYETNNYNYYQITNIRYLDPDPNVGNTIRSISLNQYLWNGYIGFMTAYFN